MIFPCIFNYFYVVDYIDGFPYVEPSLHPWDEAYMILVNYSFGAFLDSVGHNFVEYFCIDVHEEIGLKFSFLVWCLSGLCISIMVAS